MGSQATATAMASLGGSDPISSPSRDLQFGEIDVIAEPPMTTLSARCRLPHRLDQQFVRPRPRRLHAFHAGIDAIGFEHAVRIGKVRSPSTSDNHLLRIDLADDDPRQPSALAWFVR
jgi:hypothetical protein